MAYLSFTFDPNNDSNVKTIRLVELHVGVSRSHKTIQSALDEALNVLAEIGIKLPDYMGDVEWSESDKYSEK